MTTSDREPLYVRMRAHRTREDFDAVVEGLEAHLRALKRTRLDRLEPDALIAEFVRYERALAAFDEFYREEAFGLIRDCWRCVTPIEEVDRVRRRASRQRALAGDHFLAVRKALLAHGQPGIEAIRALFLQGQEHQVWWLREEAVRYFPDEAEPVFEALLALPDDGSGPSWRQNLYREAIAQIQGYRARRADDLAPELAFSPEAGLAPALSTLDRSPAEFPTLLFERFVRAILTGELAFLDALYTAWREVVAIGRLDPKHLEPAELAVFDVAYRRQLTKALFDSYDEDLQSLRLEYIHTDGSRVTEDEVRAAVRYVCWTNHETPYRPAAAWWPRD